ncbi:MAG: carboxypeptidase-like regulatory domain-containing protein, partial [Verrucomicrobiota bacterium]
ITAKKPFEMMTVQVTARSFAPADFNKLASGTTRHELKLTEGATLTGRVLSGGKPLSAVSVGVSGLDRSAGNYRGHFEVGTGTNGTFAFLNLPPNVEFYVYGIMNTMNEHGAIPIQTIRSGKDGEVTRLGDLVVGPANRLAGRLVLADGKPIPPKTRLLVSREQAWDSMQLTLDEEGRFDTTGIPSETISLSARVKGYRVSAQNKSLDQLNFRMIGRVDRDVTNLVYLLEKGPDLEPNYNVGSAYEWPGERPLRGAEGGIDHSLEWAVSGRVLDSNTKEPIAQFQVTSGQTDQFERTSWDTLHASEGSNGVYLNYVSKRFAEPLLKVEAEGYLPASRTISANNSTNIDFILTKGTGPSGTVLNSEGKPVDGATVIQIGNDFNAASLDGKGELNAYWNKNISTKTTTNGHFSFKPVWGTKSVAAASSKGFAFVSLESLATNSTLTLEPFGQIFGTLKRTSGLGTNEDLDLAFADLSPGRSPINLNNHTKTDSQGRFEFINVPAGHLRISYRQPMPGPNRGGWMSPKLQDVELHPGQRLEVNIETSDRPAPDDTMSYRPPEPKRIAGAEVKGIVLNPAGQPAAESAVALQVTGKYLAIGKGAFASTGARHDGSIVDAGADGSFTLPLYEGAKSVIALNEEGYAQVSLDQLKASPQIRLQKWGRIEGTLRIGQHAGTNESVVLSTAPRPLQMRARPSDRQTNDLTVTDSSSIALEPPIYEFDAFKAKTDEQGRFVITFVPPGEHGIARLVPNGENSWRHRLLGTVMVKSGETAHCTFGGNGRTIIGKIKFAESEMPDLKRASVMINTPISRLMEKSRQLKTDEERKAFYQSEEFQAATKVQRSFPATLQADGSFRVDDVLPGTYEVAFQPQLQPTLAMRSFTVFTSKQELNVPEAGKSDDSPVDWGAIEMKKLTVPIPETPAAKK